MSDVSKSSLHVQVVDDLLKSGFASELRVIEIFEGCGWGAFAGIQFYDSSVQKSREIDIHVIQSDVLRDDDHPSFEMTSEFWVEVKKTERPWVVLRGADASKYLDLETVFGRPHSIEAFPSRGELRAAFGKNTLAVREGWFGHGIHESFRKAGDRSRWYSAFAKLARISRHPSHSVAFFKSHEGRSHIRLTQPLVVLDGPLLSARTAEGAIQVADILQATVEFGVSDSETHKGTIQIDVVTLPALADYLSHASGTVSTLSEMAAEQLKVMSSQIVPN
jgi:hypothetical protein